MMVRAHGRIVFWGGASLWVLGTRSAAERYPRTAVHSHHAVQVTLALRGRFSLVDRGRLVGGPAAAVAADTEHAFEAEGVVAHLFIDPDGRQGRAVTQELFAEARVVSIPEDRIAQLATGLLETFESPERTDAELVEWGHRLVARLAGDDVSAPQPDARVRKMLAWAATRLEHPLTLAGAAEFVGLSNGRARHLFVEQTGLPFRAYVLWLRVTKAMELYVAGESLTAAAHAAGFSDSAHLSRTFRRMFGITADSLRMI
jgi:AraC family transcriptional regulator